MFCGMLASLQAWFPSIPLNIPNLRKATAGMSKFSWIKILEYDESKKLRLVKDGASSIGVGFVLFQYLSDQNPEKGAVIISANSSLLGEAQVGYSPIDAELLELDFAARA